MAKLYIIHGWTYKPEPWQEVIAELKKKKIDAELLRVPGLGTQSDQVFTMDDYVEWAATQIPKGSIALGHSNGGRILLNMLRKKGSDYLSGLILFDAAGIYEPSLKNMIMRKMSKVFSPLKKSKLAWDVIPNKDGYIKCVLRDDAGLSVEVNGGPFEASEEMSSDEIAKAFETLYGNEKDE